MALVNVQSQFPNQSKGGAEEKQVTPVNICQGIVHGKGVEVEMALLPYPLEILGIIMGLADGEKDRDGGSADPS